MENFIDEPLLFSFWHGELFFSPIFYRELKKSRKRETKILISEHFDGGLIADVAKLVGADSIRGSTSKGAKRVLIQALKACREGNDIGITPDGPRGPYRSIAAGIIYLSQKTETKVVVLRAKSSRFWELRSWDRFMIPKPFSIIDFYASKPFILSGMELNEAKSFLKKRMEQYDF